eukprot:CAMPEP_0119291078 /NCGR_PEP_ID=MMETSP1329-20130426/41861_1 /TAXON_ID=114041 /ORGANISM="Genus nov. species nov., Strain RCC1024" /LENGTH=55 /DNA_ID=CAMNT_0007291903 /DNA_START=37 /DNA_END=200 /DNA_ORIENTATION=-
MLDTASMLLDEGVGLLKKTFSPEDPVEALDREIEAKNERATREGFALGRVVWFGG